MVGPEHDPATETVPQVNDSGTTDEPNHIWESCSQGQDENIVLLEVSHVAYDSDPNKHCACSEKDAADIITSENLCLDFYFKNGTDDGECITGDDEDIPAVQKLQPIGPWNLLPLTD